MSITTDRSTLTRLQKDIANLRKKDATEAKKEVDASSRANRALQAAARAGSPSSAQMRLREAERHQADAARSTKKRADYAQQIARKLDEANRVQDRLTKLEAAERKKEADKLSKLTRNIQLHEEQYLPGRPCFTAGFPARNSFMAAG